MKSCILQYLVVHQDCVLFAHPTGPEHHLLSGGHPERNGQYQDQEDWDGIFWISEVAKTGNENLKKL